MMQQSAQAFKGVSEKENGIRELDTETAPQTSPAALLVV
jgi:hypothetical protein